MCGREGWERVVASRGITFEGKELWFGFEINGACCDTSRGAYPAHLMYEYTFSMSSLTASVTH